MKLKFFFYLIATAVATVLTAHYAKNLQGLGNPQAPSWYIVSLACFVIGGLITLVQGFRDGFIN